jgi:hypothetical protein
VVNGWQALHLSRINDSAYVVGIRVGSKISRVFLISVKETRRDAIMSAKCPVFGTFAHRLREVII